MNFERYFKQIILERGQQYYRLGCVQDLSYDGKCYHANVIGEVPYRVEIKMTTDKIDYMKCSCPHAASGNYCKHMAAMLYAIKDTEKNEKDTALKPFEESAKKYQYFDIQRITENIEFSESSFADAKKLLNGSKVVLDRVDIGYQSYGYSDQMCGVVRGHYCEKGAYDAPLTIVFEQDRILKASCGVRRCSGGYDPYYYQSRVHACKHLLALLILLEEYLNKYNPGDATDRSGASLVQAFRSRHISEVIEQQTEQVNDLILEPVLERDGTEVSAAFRVGIGKMYVVKHLTEFVKQYENKDTLLLGTKTEINLAKHRFSEASKEIFQFVQQAVEEETDRMERMRSSNKYYYAEELKSRIDLFGEKIDLFYELNEGKTIACNDKTGRKTVKTTVTFQKGKPDIRLTIRQNQDEKGVFHGISVAGKIAELIKGRNHYYYFKGENFYQIDEKCMQEIEPLLRLGKMGDFELQVGRKNLSEFYHQILPVLKKNVHVNEMSKAAIAAYIPPEAEFSFYLDAEQGDITCEPKASYGEEVVSLIDNYREDAVIQEFRNCHKEEEILYHVAKLFEMVDLEKEVLHCADSEDAVLRLLDGGLERLMALGEVHTTDRFRSMSIRKKPTIKVGVSIESDLMNLSIASDELSQSELLEILQSYRKKKKYYRLKSGSLVEVNDTDIEMLSQMMEGLQISPKDFVKGNMKIPVYRALYLNKMLEQSENLYLNRDKYFKKIIKEFKTVEDSDFEVPASLMDIMRNYQLQGFKWLKTLEQYGFGGILADDMGLGKTLQMISVLLAAKEEGRLEKALIISPASLVYNWKEEFARFAPELSVGLIVGNQQERAELIKNSKGKDVLVTSYDLLKRDIAEYEGQEFQYQVLDEAQYIKNHNTAAAKSVKVIKSRHRYALTGTPIENRLSELWSIFDYLMPGFLYGYEKFRKEIEMPIVKHKEDMASERLKKMVAPFILRRLKSEVLKDLPDKIEEIRYARFDTEQQRIYDGQVVHMRKMLEEQGAEEFQKNKMQILAELTKIRQICCDPELLFENYRDGSAKRVACMELLQSAIEGEHKILLFSQFTTMLELLEAELKSAGITYYKITGATPKEKRVEMVDAFNKDQTNVFLISLKAGGTGLNLTGADVVIHYDPWWNQAVQNQATDRAHRIGQKNIVSVYKLIAKNTIEEKIVKMQESKKDLADTILNGETGGLSQMSKEELLELLTG